MTELHTSHSAVSQRFEEEVAAVAQRYYEDEGRPEGRATDHWLRAEQEVRARQATPPNEVDRQIEEAMHLDQ